MKDIDKELDTQIDEPNLDNVLTTLVDDWAEFMLHGKSPDGAIAIGKAKRAIIAIIATQIQEARIDELEHLKLDIGLFPMSYGKDDDKWQERQRNIAKIEKRIAKLKGE